MNPQFLRGSQASCAPFGVTTKAVPRQTYPTILSAIPDLDRLNATMSSSNDEPGFRVVENVIEDQLINDAAKEVTQASVVKTEAETYSRLECGPACEKLLDCYRKEKHSQTATKPEIIDIVKSPSKTEATMSLVMRIKPQNPGEKPCLIELPGNYHIIIPLVLQGLPK